MGKANAPAAGKPRRHGGGAGRPFVKGQSGNPGGRPKEIAHVRELARSRTVEAVETLTDIMRNPDEPAAARVRAAETLLDRGWGRPTQPISGEDGKAIETHNLHALTDDQLLAIALAGSATPP